jgi:hypothetical protein
LGLSFSLGRLWEQVKNSSVHIAANKSELKTELDSYRRENREDHQLIFDKIDELSRYVRNGHGKG